MKKVWMIILIIVFLCSAIGCTRNIEDITISPTEPILSTLPSETATLSTSASTIDNTNPTNSISKPNGGENMINRENLEIIKKKTGIDFQDSSEVLTIELDDSMKFESASLKIMKESVELIILQLNKEEWHHDLDDRHIPPIWYDYIENVDDYMFFAKFVPSKVNKGLDTTDLLIIPNRENDTYTAYIFYIGE